MNRFPKILVMDDDENWLRQAPQILDGFAEVYCCSTIDQGLETIRSTFFDIVLLDINFQGDQRDGLDVFRMIQAADRGCDVIVISGETKPERLIQIMNSGVTQFLVKPVPPKDVVRAVNATLERREFNRQALERIGGNPLESGSVLIGNSTVMNRLRENIARVVKGGTKDILIQGETGTGKEIVAKCIAETADPAKRFIPIHCGAISEGIAESELFGHVKGAFTGADKDRVSAFEAVGGGFVFFDEIGDMPLVQQAKLLRVIQERKVQRVGSLEEIDVNFRTVSATHVNLDEAVQKRQFREDLYYRIAKEKIVIPPLRERREDIPNLVQHFIVEAKGSKAPIVTNDAMELLAMYHWPGNVRQLKTAIESICSKIDGRVIREKDVCLAIPQITAVFGTRATKALVGRYGVGLISREKERFEKAILETSGDRDRAAKKLGLSRATFFRRAKELGLVRDRKQRESQAL